MPFDRQRVIVIGLCLLLLAWLGVSATDYAENREVGIRAALQDPAAYDGQEVLLMMWTVGSVQGPRRWTADKYHHQVAVIGDSAGLSPGDTVTARGVFRAQGPTVEAAWQQLHRWRQAKLGLGILGTVLALVGLPLGFRLRGGRLVERG